MSGTESGSAVRFGLLCDGTTVPDYVALALRRLLVVGGVSLSALLTVDDARTDAGQSGGSAGDDRGDDGSTSDAALPVAWASDLAWDLYLSVRSTPASVRPVDLSDELDGVERVPCDPDRVRALDLDFAFAPMPRLVDDAVIDVPRYGVWAYTDHTYTEGRRTRYFTEISDGVDVTAAYLCRLASGGERPLVLWQGYFPTVPSYAANADRARYGSAKWPAQVATDLLNGHNEYLETGRSAERLPPAQEPSVGDLCRYLVGVATAKAGILARGVSDWNVGVVDASIETSRQGGLDGRVDWYDGSVSDGFVADPFACELDGTTYVFVEEYSYETERGHIAYVEYEDGFGQRGVAVEEPFHMSYPYLFEYDGTVYATPETQDADEIRLYRVDRPDSWHLERVIQSDVRAADPTVVRYDDRWWLFCTRDGTHTSSLTDLDVYHATDPTGEWTPHDNNPVKTDVRSARPGGTPFVFDGTLYRPAQDCAGGYGERVVVNRVDELSRTSFTETRVATVGADAGRPYPDGRHTVSACGEFTLVDGKRTVWNEFTWRRTRRLLRSKLGF